MKKKKILIIAGEASGDLQASHLVKSLKSLNPHLEIFGLGGKNMKEAGVKIIYNMVDLAVVGFLEVIKHIGTFKAIFNSLVSILDTKKPDAVILVDYPGFNMRFAKVAKSKNIPVIYYISPQIWAWGQERIEEIKKYVDKMIVIFGFEEKLYRSAGVKVSFVGHPFLEIVKSSQKRETTLKHLHARHNTVKVALLPGSRAKEVERHLPVMLKACEMIKTYLPKSEFILSRRKELGKKTYNRTIRKSAIKPHSLENQPYEIMDAADLVIVSSGSATLETAIMEKPMIVIYKTSIVTWLLAKNLIKIPNIGLVNVVAEKKIVPELVQFGLTYSNLAEEALKILKDRKLRDGIKKDLRELKQKLGSPGACQRAAQIIQSMLH